uniref:Uncharacterized protein n=1 Tax=Hyaloperonospora arabidopsidis (strain Emoy2) TaxID=559515 RepID=M4B7L8_HYAAE
MVNESRNATVATPVTAGRTPYAEPSSASSPVTPAEEGVERAIHFDDFETSDQDSEEDGRAEDKDNVGLIDEVEELSLHVGNSSNPRGVATHVVNKRDEEEDGGQDVTPGERPPLAPRAILNVETPMENRTLNRLGELSLV